MRPKYVYGDRPAPVGVTVIPETLFPRDVIIGIGATGEGKADGCRSRRYSSGRRKPAVATVIDIMVRSSANATLQAD
jgi:hypothetical protein